MSIHINNPDAKPSGILSAEQIADYKTRYRSASIYMPIWRELKQNNIVTVSTSDIQAKTINAAIIRLKQQDYYFKVACDEEIGRQLQMFFEYSQESATMTIKLMDVVDKMNPINLL